jgi:uncharacterized linocin/CFP29 family protein
MVDSYFGLEDAPIKSKTADFLKSIMVDAAKSVLSGRRLLDIEGPFGLGLKVLPLADGESETGIITSAGLPLSLIEKSFTMSTRDIAAFELDGVSLEAAELAEAAIEAARMEDGLIFKGSKEVPGLLAVKGSSSLNLASWDQVGNAVNDIIEAVTLLDGAGLHGPYSLALAPARYNLLLRRYPTGNFSELEHIKTIATQGIVKAPAIEKGGILIASGRQFLSIVLGQDMTLNFIGPSAERMEFSIQESLVLRVRQPRAICVLKEE